MPKYTDRLIYMEGIIVEVHDGAVGIDLKGRLGFLKIPMRMLISDYEIKAFSCMKYICISLMCQNKDILFLPPFKIQHILIYDTLIFSKERVL